MNFLATLFESIGDGDIDLPYLFESEGHYNARLRRQMDKRYISNSISRLKKTGSIEVKTEGRKKFLILTSKGELEVLFNRSQIKTPIKWDKKWRLVMFDIPYSKDANIKRDELRRYVKKLGFVMLQQSVYISPFPLNKASIIYLKKSGLIDYIRFLKVEEMDDDTKFLKHFKLN